MDSVISEPCCIETILQINYRKMTIHGHFPIIPLHRKHIGSHNMTKLYPNLCYNNVCCVFHLFTIFDLISTL